MLESWSCVPPHILLVVGLHHVHLIRATLGIPQQKSYQKTSKM